MDFPAGPPPSMQPASPAAAALLPTEGKEGALMGLAAAAEAGSGEGKMIPGIHPSVSAKRLLFSQQPLDQWMHMNIPGVSQVSAPTLCLCYIYNRWP